MLYTLLRFLEHLCKVRVHKPSSSTHWALRNRMCSRHKEQLRLYSGLSEDHKEEPCTSSPNLVDGDRDLNRRKVPALTLLRYYRL